MLIYPDINPVAIHLGPIKIFWYGIMYVLAFAIAWGLLPWRIRQPNNPSWNIQQGKDLLFYAALGVVVGGRVGYMLFYALPDLLQHPLNLFKTWEGGMSFHGGLIGVCCALWLFQRKTHHSFVATTDFIAPLVPLGLAAGRLGNFINGELWGRATDVPWAMVVDGLVPRHPSQLYELIGEGLLLFLLLWYYARKPQPPGKITGLFLLGYATIRFALEFVRQPDWQLGYLAFGWLTMGQLLCVPMLVLGLWLVYRSYFKM